MFCAIQNKLKQATTAQEGFRLMDKGIGFLNIKDIIGSMPSLFGISVKREEFLRLFKEIDTDKDGIIRYKEFEEFYNKDYEQSLKTIEKQKDKINIQYEIFDHLIKVLR